MLIQSTLCGSAFLKEIQLGLLESVSEPVLKRTSTHWRVAKWTWKHHENKNAKMFPLAAAEGAWIPPHVCDGNMRGSPGQSAGPPTVKGHKTPTTQEHKEWTSFNYLFIMSIIVSVVLVEKKCCLLLQFGIFEIIIPTCSPDSFRFLCGLPLSSEFCLLHSFPAGCEEYIHFYWKKHALLII